MSTEKNNLKVEKTAVISDELLKLLNNTILGTPGKLRYKHTELEKTLRSIENLEFIQISKRDRVLGTAGIVHREVKSNKYNFKSLYVRYLSVYNPFRKRSKSVIQKRNDRENSLRDRIINIFKKELETDFYDGDTTGLFYAFVEKDNSQSRNLCESFGFKVSKEISTFLFSRLSPRTSNKVRILNPEELSSFKKGIADFYSNHSLFFDDLKHNNTGKLYGYFLDGELIAGLRAFPVKWKLIEVPGFSGFLMTRLLPHLPFFKRLFSSDTFEFIAFDHIWFRQGRKDLVEKMMESVCAETGIHIGMSWQDSESEISTYFRNHCKLGLLDKINGEVKADLMIRKINMNDDYSDELLKKPIFISGIDMT